MTTNKREQREAVRKTDTNKQSREMKREAERESERVQGMQRPRWCRRGCKTPNGQEQCSIVPEMDAEH